VPRDDYWIGVPEGGTYSKILDSDAERYGGAGYSRQQQLSADAHRVNDHPFRLRVNLPPLAALYLRPDR
jgi:1,4-alpha-glucan branching enzyme